MQIHVWSFFFPLDIKKKKKINKWNGMSISNISSITFKCNFSLASSLRNLPCHLSTKAASRRYDIQALNFPPASGCSHPRLCPHAHPSYPRRLKTVTRYRHSRGGADNSNKWSWKRLGPAASALSGPCVQDLELSLPPWHRGMRQMLWGAAPLPASMACSPQPGHVVTRS